MRIERFGVKAKQKPQQARAQATFEKLIEAAQALLEESGIEALTSNAVVEKAGMTPPAFYRYFPNKHALLEELGRRLMERQNDIILEMQLDRPLTRDEFIAISKKMLERTVDVTRKFRGGYALLVSLRAIPELQHVRLISHEDMATVLADRAPAMGVGGTKRQLLAKSRLAIEVGYAALEMLFETGFRHQSLVLESTARANAAIFEIG